MSAPVPPPSSRIDDHGSPAHRFGALVGLATVGTLACTLPAALRVSAALTGASPVVRAWSALVATTLVPMCLAVAVLRGAWSAWRDLGEAASPPRVFGVGLWVAGLFVWMVLFGGFLRATTHHHALAGVTYAFGALALAGGWGLVCWRTAAIFAGFAEKTQPLAMASLGVPLFVAILYIAVRFLVVASRDASSALAAATVIDVFAFCLAGLFGSADWRLMRRLLAAIGPPLALFLGALGLTTLGDPAVLQAIREHAPAFAYAAGLIPGH
jgi:hypothetical protein